MEINNYRYMQQIEGRNESLNTLINTGLITNLVSQYIQYAGDMVCQYTVNIN